jgi:hypothetical protein
MTWQITTTPTFKTVHLYLVTSTFFMSFNVPEKYKDGLKVHLENPAFEPHECWPQVQKPQAFIDGFKEFLKVWNVVFFMLLDGEHIIPHVPPYKHSQYMLQHPPSPPPPPFPLSQL